MFIGDIVKHLTHNSNNESCNVSLHQIMVFLNDTNAISLNKFISLCAQNNNYNNDTHLSNLNQNITLMSYLIDKHKNINGIDRYRKMNGKNNKNRARYLSHDHMAKGNRNGNKPNENNMDVLKFQMNLQLQNNCFVENKDKKATSVLNDIANNCKVLSKLRLKYDSVNISFINVIEEQKEKLENLRVENAMIINEFEENWEKWKLEDTICWFKYVIYCKNSKDFNLLNDDVLQDTDGCEVTDSEEEEDDDDDDREEYERKDNNRMSRNGKKNFDDENDDEIKFNQIEAVLKRKRFRAKYYLEKMNKNKYRTYGFDNQTHYRLLDMATRDLIQRHPPNKSQKRVNKSPLENLNLKDPKVNGQIEGAVEVTQPAV